MAANIYPPSVVTLSSQEFENQEIDYLQAKRNYESNDVQISQITESISNANKTSKGTELNRRREEINLFKKVLQSFALHLG